MGFGEVYSTDIGNKYYEIVKWIVLRGAEGIKKSMGFVASIFKFLATWLMYSIQFFPLYLFIGIVGILATFFWNQTLKPLIQLLIKVLNGAIRSWNKVASSLRNLGFDIPLPTGTVGIRFGIPVPDAKEIHANIPDFLPFVLEILIPNLFNPLKKSLTGIIFAKDPVP